MATFKARARALDMLGRQQIAGLPTAINELFKNAHDAYADKVIVDYFRQTGLFVLRDDGTGMTEQDFVGRWMTLGTESKLGNEEGGMPPPPKDPTKSERPILGEKGIGRLSIAVIGPQVLVLTRAMASAGQDALVAAFILWELFTVPGIDLDEVEIPINLFPGGTLPGKSDVDALVAATRENIGKLASHISPERQASMNDLLDRFSVDPISLAQRLGSPSLADAGHGTQFYILPCDEALEAIIDQDTEDTASPLIKGLIGFTNTMTPSHNPPQITASFRDHRDDLSHVDLIDAFSFFIPEEFNEADHHFEGVFDPFGQFRGTVTVYGKATEHYQVPWSDAGGRRTECGPFRLSLAYIQGRLAQSRLSADRFVALTRKLNRLGGLYIYKDGIRVLPYGDTDYDWLDIEKNRTKSAYYYFFSYRRLYGVIEIASATNAGLSEKAGREGFRQNRAYRQFRAILKNFFQQVATDFFREEGTFADHYFAQRTELERLERTRQRREKEAGAKRRAFGQALEEVLRGIQSGKPEQEITALRAVAQQEVMAAVASADPARAMNVLVDAEVKGRRSIEGLREKYRVAKPRGVGLTRQLRREWDFYLQEDARLQTAVFEPALRDLAKLVTETGREMHLDVDRTRRLERGLQDKIEQARKAVSTQTSQARSAIEDLRSRALNLVRECGIALERTASEVLSQLAQMDLVGMPEEKVEAVYRDLESSISTRLASEAEVLRELCDQLQQVNWSQDDNGDRVIDIQATAEALEEELLGLREQADMDAELVQLGLAAAIVNHEYETAIRTVRSALRRLKPWADANKRMGDLYRELRIGFDHLDGYLRLLTPLQRSLFRAPVAFTGAAIEQYLRALFRGHLEREAASIEVTPAFRQMTIYGNPATFYAVFVNLVDNALFWLRPIPAPRIVRLDAQGNSFTIADTGQGVANRDREAIFEAGFTRKPGGRGLGLFIARESLRKEGYQLTLLPSGPSGGATFRIEKAVDQQTGKVE